MRFGRFTVDSTEARTRAPSLRRSNLRRPLRGPQDHLRSISSTVDIKFKFLIIEMKFKVAFRKKSKALSYRKRYLSLSSIEQVRLKKLKKLILALMVESELSEGADEKEDINLMLEALVAKYLL